MKWILLLSISLFCQAIFGQELNKTYTLKLKDGSVIYNVQILEINKDVWILNNSILGILQIDKEQIDAIITENGKEIVVSRGKQTRFTAYNPVPERYVALPSAFNLPKGEATYLNFMLLGSNLNYGITDNISVGATFPTFIIFPAPAISLHTKYSFSLTEQTKLSFQIDVGGAIIPFVGTTLIDNYGMFLPQAVISFGDRRKNTSFRLGRVDILGTERFGSFLAGYAFCTPITNKLFFVSDNLATLNADPVLLPSGGLRFVGKRKKSCFDLGAMGAVDFNQTQNSGVTFYFTYQKNLKK